MIFISGISSKYRELDHRQTLVCPSCLRYSSMEFFEQYKQLSLFFIPIFKWSKKYLVSCRECGSHFSLDENIAKDIKKGNPVEINDEDLSYIGETYNFKLICDNCNNPCSKDYEFCPKCGGKL